MVASLSEDHLVRAEADMRQRIRYIPSRHDDAIGCQACPPDYSSRNMMNHNQCWASSEPAAETRQKVKRLPTVGAKLLSEL
jgi:hypothetical protein